MHGRVVVHCGAGRWFESTRQTACVRLNWAEASIDGLPWSSTSPTASDGQLTAFAVRVAPHCGGMRHAALDEGVRARRRPSRIGGGRTSRSPFLGDVGTMAKNTGGISGAGSRV